MPPTNNKGGGIDNRNERNCSVDVTGHKIGDLDELVTEATTPVLYAQDNTTSWAYKTGVLAWATQSPSIWPNRWPVLLYPSWSTAMNCSGFVHSSQKTEKSAKKGNGEEDTERISIQQSRTPISIDSLRKNLVPANAALGPALDKYHGKRRRVVAYFLGRPPSGWDEADHLPVNKEDFPKTITSPWRALNVDTLQLYNATSCAHNLQACKSQKESVTCKCCDTLTTHRDHLLHAMKEASIVCQCPNLDPQVIAPRLFHHNHTPSILNATIDRSIPRNPTITKSLPIKKTNNATPEFFDEWTVGQSLNTQKSTTENDTQFSQGLGGSFSLSLAGISNQLDQNYDLMDQIHPTGRTIITLQEKHINEETLSKFLPVSETDSQSLPAIELDTISCTLSPSNNVSSSSSILSDDTPITSNVTHSQLNAASVLMNLNQTSSTDSFRSPNNPSSINQSQKRKDKNLSVSFELIDNGQTRNHPVSCDNKTSSSARVVHVNEKVEPLEWASIETITNKRRRLSPSDDVYDKNFSSCCSLQGLSTVPIVTPRPILMKKIDESNSKSDDIDHEGPDNDMMDETDDGRSKQLFLYTQ